MRDIVVRFLAFLRWALRRLWRLLHGGSRMCMQHGGRILQRVLGLEGAIVRHCVHQRGRGGEARQRRVRDTDVVVMFGVVVDVHALGQDVGDVPVMNGRAAVVHVMVVGHVVGLGLVVG